MAKARPITGLDAHAPTGRNARIIARIRLDELYDWSRYVDDVYHGRELHNLRIAAKRLRYTLEIFEAVLSDASLSIVKELEMIQEELGALHDSDVMIALLRLCLGGQDGSTVPDQTTSHPGEQRLPARGSGHLRSLIHKRFGIAKGMFKVLCRRKSL